MRDELSRALAPVKGRLRLSRAIRGAAWGALAGGCACLIVMALSFLMPVPGRLHIQGLILCACVLVPGLIALILPLSDGRAARAADACGLQERALTALALRGREDNMSLLQRKDAIQALRALSVRRVPVKAPVRPLAGCAGALLLSAALLLLPNDMAGEAARMERFAQAMEEAGQAAQEAQDALDSRLTPQEAQALRKLLGDLSRTMRSARDSREAYLALNEAQERLEKLRDSIGKSASQALSGAGLESLQSALESGDAQAMQAAAQALMQNAGESAQALKAAAASLSGTDAQAMQAAASALTSGDLSALQSALSSLSAAQLAQAMGQVQALLSQLRAAAGMPGGQTLQGQQGQGQGASLGAQGDGDGTQGAGRGHTNIDQGYKEDTGRQRGAGLDTPEYREDDYEAIYDPTRLNAADTPIQESGRRGAGDSLQMQTGPGLGALDGDVPYRAVAGEYRQAAARAMSGLSLPDREREWVDDYFAAITE